MQEGQTEDYKQEKCVTCSSWRMFNEPFGYCRNPKSPRHFIMAHKRIDACREYATA